MEYKEVKQIKVKKDIPTIFPTGFSIKGTDSRMFFLEFIDSMGEEKRIVGSFAIEEETVKKIADSLLEALKKSEEKESE